MDILSSVVSFVLSVVAFVLFIGWLYTLGNGLSWFLFRRRRNMERISIQGYAVWFAVIIGIPVIMALLGTVMGY